MKKFSSIFIVIIFLFVFTIYVPAQAIMLDFEDLPDLTSVDDFYASLGIHFENAISLTAGFSLNEFDYPPSSGIVAVGDDWAPILLTFDNPAENIFAHFTYASQLTFTAWNDAGDIIGTYINPNFDNLGTSELISLNFSGVSKLQIAGEWDGSFIMDDLNYELNQYAPVPEPGTMFLFGSGLVGVAGLSFGRKKLSSKES